MGSNTLTIGFPDEKKVIGQSATTRTQSGQSYGSSGASNINVYSGSNYTFQNYDGFERGSDNNADDMDPATYTRMIKEGDDAKAEATEAGDNADTSMSGAKKSAKKAQENVDKLHDQDAAAAQRGDAAATTITSNNNKVKELTEESEQLNDETEDIYKEVEELMAEDGETFTAPALAPTTVAPIPSDGDNGGQFGGGNQGGGFNDGANNLGGSGQNGNFFAMNSLPAGGATLAPTSETAVAATRSASPQQGGGAQQSRQATSSIAKTSLSQAKGKNSDKINSLLAKASSNQSKVSSNTSSASALNIQTGNLFKSTQAYFNSSITRTNEIKATSEDGYGAAQTTVEVGQYTTMVGTATQAVGIGMQAFWPTCAAGITVERVGSGVTTVGGLTTTAGQFSAGQNQNGMSTATQSLQSLSNLSTKLKSAKDS